MVSKTEVAWLIRDHCVELYARSQSLKGVSVDSPEFEKLFGASRKCVDRIGELFTRYNEMR